MWGEMARIIHEVRPKFVFVENSPMLTSRGLGRVLGDLASMGFDARWGVLGAADIGANHQRDRIWIVGKLAYPKKLLGNGGNNNARISMERETQSEFGNDCWSEVMAYANSAHGKGNQCAKRTQKEHANADSTSQLAYTQNEGYVRWLGSMGATESQHHNRGSQVNGGREWWQVEPNVGRVADGVAARVDRLKAIGNGQVPLCAATAWRILSQ
jgi:DNA (cytosine-5)-methyltransferase 1